MEEQEIVDAEVVAENRPEPSTEVVRQEDSSATLFHTTDPVEVVQKASIVATALRNIIVAQGLTTRIGGGDHVRVEGWQTLGSMIGVFPVKEWVEVIDWPDPTPPALAQFKERGLTFGFRASFKAQRADGAVVGGGQAECRRTESSWKGRDDFALASMAQTRATSKALKSPLGFIVTMAGYEATPAEEMASVEVNQYGPGMEDAEYEKLTRAITYLTDDAALTVKIKRTIQEEAGYMPKIVSRALLHTARLIRDNKASPDTEVEYPS